MNVPTSQNLCVVAKIIAMYEYLKVLLRSRFRFAAGAFACYKTRCSSNNSNLFRYSW